LHRIAARNIRCILTRESPLKKKLFNDKRTMFHGFCKASVKLTQDIVPAMASSGVVNIMHFKNRQVSLQHAVSMYYD
jgi:hypothetical protein